MNRLFKLTQLEKRHYEDLLLTRLDDIIDKVNEKSRQAAAFKKRVQDAGGNT